LFLLNRKKIDFMNLISLVVVLIVVGVLLYVVETLIPMDIRIKRAIEIIVLLGVFLYILQSFGLIGGTAIHLK
jgi:hypothetical protein